MAVKSVEEGRWSIACKAIYPGMTRWFSPVLLLRLLVKTAVSALFGQYADRRLMIAALDEEDLDQQYERTQLQNKLLRAPDGALWFDYVADLGDGFDATYAVAYLLAQDQLRLPGVDDALPRGEMLILGGDQVYPNASRETYTYQLHDPYELARPDPDRLTDEGPSVYAIPGNHDWYDGLVMFLALFCGEKPWHLGAWRARQRRSYFALQLTAQWWIWATDIQLADNMDQPQADYFRNIAAKMPDNAKIILCGAEPGWLYTRSNRSSWDIVNFAGRIATEVKKGITIPILVSGDTHHYSRYASDDGMQFVTSGGGGAFLHPTHQLDDRVELDWQSVNKQLSLLNAGKPGEPPAATCYPSRDESRRLLKGDFAFPFQNWDFALLMGGIYLLLSLPYLQRPLWDTIAVAGTIFCSVFFFYSRYQEKSSGAKIYVTSILHGLAHTLALIGLTIVAKRLNVGFDFSGDYFYLWPGILYVIEMFVAGSLVGASLFGFNLYVTCRYFAMNHNDAFSAMRLPGYKNFLRIRIKDEQVTLHAIGLDAVPRRSGWHDTEIHHGQPRYEPNQPLQPKLIDHVTV